MTKVGVVVGVGPGLGQSLVDRFATEGFHVGMIARSPGTLNTVKENLSGHSDRLSAYDCDATDREEVSETFERIADELGPVDVLIYNAGAYEPGGILELDPERFEECWQANCNGGFLTAREVLPSMVEREEGTVLFTGATASLRGSDGFSGLAVGKFGLRALAQSMAREYGPKGIHVAHVIIDGQIATPTNLKDFPDRDPDTFLDPDAIARSYWELYRQDQSAWTLELDLRPHREDF